MRYIVLFLCFISVFGLNCSDYYGIKKCKCSIGDKLKGISGDFLIKRHDILTLSFANGSIFTIVNLPNCYISDSIMSQVFISEHLDDFFHPINKTNSSNNTL